MFVDAGGEGARRESVSRGGAVPKLTGARLSGVPGVDSSRGLAQEHDCDMRKPLGVPARVYSGSSRVRNGGAALGGVGSPARCVPGVPGATARLN